MTQRPLRTQVPAGTRDYAPGECAGKRHLENIFRTEFLASGYDEIESPAFEYDEVFRRESSAYVQENVIRFFDPAGRILALRPDATRSAARLAATRLLEKQDPLRLFYIARVYQRQHAGHRSETTQAGAELIGAGGPSADAEVIELAVRALRASFVRDLF